MDKNWITLGCIIQDHMLAIGLSYHHEEKYQKKKSTIIKPEYFSGVF